MKANAAKTAEIRTRDYLMVKVICGATKGGVHVDRKKEAARKACRKTVKGDE